jgi:hypothetical protein
MMIIVDCRHSSWGAAVDSYPRNPTRRALTSSHRTRDGTRGEEVTLRSEQRIIMGLIFSRELQAKDNDVLPLTDDRMQNKKSTRAAASSDTDGKQLDPVKKRRRVVKEEEYLVKIEEDIEDDLQRVKDEPEERKKHPAVVEKEKEDETTEMKEGIGDDLQKRTKLATFIVEVRSGLDGVRPLSRESTRYSLFPSKPTRKVLDPSLFAKRKDLRPVMEKLTEAQWRVLMKASLEEA